MLYQIRSLVPVLLSGILLISTRAEASEQSVPFAGGASGAVTSITPNPDGTRTIISEASGQSTQTGAFHTQLVHLFTFGQDENGNAIGIFSGSQIQTAANGDELWIEYEAIHDLTGSFWGIFSITGGTGRFENASGSGEFVGTESPTAFRYSFAGKISTVGSNKR